MQWFKMHTEAARDPKLNYLSDRQFRIWFNLLCMAAEQEERGVITEKPFIIALHTNGGNTEELEETLSLLEELEIIKIEDDGNLTFINFHKRQYIKESDNPGAVRERVTRYRKKKEECSADVTPCNADVTPCNADVTPCNADVTPCNANETPIKRPETRTDTDTEQIQNRENHIHVPPPEERENIPCEKIKDLYNSTCSDLPKVISLTPKRQRHITARWKEDKIRQDLAFWEEYFRRADKSDFLNGRTSQGTWRACFDWLLNPGNMTKVLEGNYDNKERFNMFREAAKAGPDEILEETMAFWDKFSEDNDKTVDTTEYSVTEEV